ncbi:MAG: CDP-alcohol phosphatidyltransferase family protein [Thermodesulfobacteriota bacterium]
MNLPNLLTLTRVLLIPVFVIFIIQNAFTHALITFAIAGLTDGIDGFIARLTHQKTELGAYLDPIADKLLLICAFLTLAIIERLPGWLAVVVITRDVIILLGVLLMILTNYFIKIGPSIISKMTTNIQIITIILALWNWENQWWVTLKTFAIYVTTLFTILSGAHYIYVGTKILNQKKGSSLPRI